MTNRLQDKNKKTGDVIAVRNNFPFSKKLFNFLAVTSRLQSEHSHPKTEPANRL